MGSTNWASVISPRWTWDASEVKELLIFMPMAESLPEWIARNAFCFPYFGKPDRRPWRERLLQIEREVTDTRLANTVYIPPRAALPKALKARAVLAEAGVSWPCE